MENFAKIILDNAQTSYDGGVIGNILRNVKLINNTKIKKEVMPYIMSLRMSGGYVAGLFFGILWILILFSVMILLCYLHYKKPKLVFNRNRIFSREKLYVIKKDKKNSYSNSAILQLFAIAAIIIPVIMLISVSFINLAYLGKAISGSADNYNPNKTSQITSMLPALKKSLFRARYYMSTFAQNAKMNTASIVEEIIVATKKMQNESSVNFNKILMKRIGVLETFGYGDQMTQIIVQFFTYSSKLLETKEQYDKVYAELYPTALDPPFSVFRFIELLRDSINQVDNCDEVCKEASAFFNKKFVAENNFAQTTFAQSFLFVMKQRNETKESVAAKSSHGRQKMAQRMAETKIKMDKLVDIAGTVREMTMGTWTKMDVKMQGAVKMIDGIIAKLSSDETSSAATRYSVIVVMLLVVPLLMIIVVVILISTMVCDGAKNGNIRLSAYASLSLLSLALFVTMLVFLVGGKIETEVCRYLRTDQPILQSANGSQLVLDVDVNRILGPILKSLPKSDFPAPSPHNVLYGIVRKCRENEPILVAIDAIRSFDARALSKPEASNKIVAIGRQLMIESLNETDPKKMMPADMQDSLKQASQMDMFKKIDIAANIDKIPRSPIYETVSDVTVPVPINIFIDRVDKYITAYGPQFRDQKKRIFLKGEFDKMLDLLQKFRLLTDTSRDLFRQIGAIPKIEPVVEKLQKSLMSMLALMSNKTRLLALANEYYDNIIVKNTPANSAGIMVKFGPRMMASLGHCRPLYEAYESSVDTACNVVVAKINAYWLYLGTVVLLLTIFIASIFLAMIKGHHSDHPEKNGAPIDMDEKKVSNKLLVDVGNEEDGSKSMV